MLTRDLGESILECDKNQSINNLYCIYIYTIADFRVAFHLCFKASRSAKPFIWKLVNFGNMEINFGSFTCE